MEEQYSKPVLDKFRQWHFWWLAIMVAVFMGFFLGIVKIGLSQNSNGSPNNNFPQIKGQVSGTKTIFEITDSNYFNITLQSSSSIEATVISAPKVVSIVIQPNIVSPVQLTFSGFLPNKTYYRYGNSFKNETVFNTDNTGSFSFVQDLSQGHHVWIQETTGTLFIPADCNTVGSFNSTTNTCTLNQDLTTNIEITDDGLTLDCNNHKLSDGFRWTSFAVLLNNRQNVTVKNCTINNATNGINAAFSNNNTFINNNLSGNDNPIRLVSSDNNTVSGNMISANGQGIALGGLSDNNVVKNNNISDILFGVTIGDQANSNRIENNTITGHSSTGIHITDLSSSNQILNNTISNNPFGIFIFQSNGTSIIDNTIQNNQNGVTVGVQSFGTKVFHNNFLNNTTQAQAFTPSSFDNGLPDGGNFWNNYDTSAEGCHNLNNDNFCDAPLLFIGGQDNFPWVRQDGWKVRLIGQNAAELAKELVNSAYLYGGKGWDSNIKEFVAPNTIKTGYNFWNQSLPIPRVDFGAGVDCSGLVMWAYNRSFDPNKSQFENFVKLENADGQFRENTASTTEAELEPGDVMFFDFDSNNFIDHVAMYVGESGGFDVVSARSVDLGIVKAVKDNLKQPEAGFVAFKRVISALRPKVLVTAGSPVDLVVTDPDGFTITPTTIISSELEFIREIPGELYYSEMEVGADGRPIDQVYSYTSKIGDYLINVIPEPDTLPTDTYNLSFTTDLATTTVLAENIPISDIPDLSYLARVSEAGVAEKIIPAKIKIKPETINLKSKGILTVFLQIEPGFGVSVSDIATSTIRLAGAQPTKTFIELEDEIQLPKIKDKNNNKDEDARKHKDDNNDDEKEKEVPTLIAKFRIRDLTNVPTGKEVSLLFMAQLFDNTKVEGSDTVRIIKNPWHAALSLSSLDDLLFDLYDSIRNLVKHLFSRFGMQKEPNSTLPSELEASQQAGPIPITSDSPTKLYRNEEWGFEFEYPEGWKIVENPYSGPFSRFNLIIVPFNEKYLPDPVLLNIVTPEFADRAVIRRKELGAIESSVLVEGIKGLKYEYTEQFLTISIDLPFGRYRMILGAKKKYEGIFNQILSSFKFLDTTK